MIWRPLPSISASGAKKRVVHPAHAPMSFRKKHLPLRVVAADVVLASHVVGDEELEMLAAGRAAFTGPRQGQEAGAHVILARPESRCCRRGVGRSGARTPTAGGPATGTGPPSSPRYCGGESASRPSLFRTQQVAGLQVVGAVLLPDVAGVGVAQVARLPRPPRRSSGCRTRCRRGRGPSAFPQRS